MTLQTYRNEKLISTLRFPPQNVNNAGGMQILDLWHNRYQNDYEIKDTIIVDSFVIDGSTTIITNSSKNMSPNYYKGLEFYFRNGPYAGGYYDVLSNTKTTITLDAILSNIVLTNRGEILERNIKSSNDVFLYTNNDFGLKYKFADSACFYANASNEYVSIDSAEYFQEKGIIRFFYKPDWDMDDGLEHRIMIGRDSSNIRFLVVKTTGDTIRFYPDFVGDSSYYCETSTLSSSNWYDTDWNFIEISWDNDFKILLSINHVQTADVGKFTYYYSSGHLTHFGNYGVSTPANGSYDELYIFKNISNKYQWTSGNLIYCPLDEAADVTSLTNGTVTSGEFTYNNMFRFAPTSVSYKLPISCAMEPNSFRTIKFIIDGTTSGVIEEEVNFTDN